MRGSKSGMEGVEARSEDVERGGVQSVGIAATILKALAAAGGVLPLKHLAAATGMPRAKVHRYLSSLRNAGLITQDPETGHYAIGSAAVTIGLVGLGRLSPIRQLNEALPRLRDRVNETVTAAIWGDTGPTIIAMEESGHVVTMNVRIGSVLPLTTTAIGQVFLAYLPDSLTQPLVSAEHASAKSSPRPARDLASAALSIFANAAFRGRRARSSRASMRLPRRCSTSAASWSRSCAWWAAPVERCATGTDRSRARSTRRRAISRASSDFWMRRSKQSRCTTKPTREYDHPMQPEMPGGVHPRHRPAADP